MAEQATVKTRKPLSQQIKLWYGVGDFGFTLMTNVETFYWNSFLTDLAGFNVATTAAITTIASIVDACLSWIYGGILNAIKPKKWGRYRSWLILAPWIVPFLYAFQFLKLGNGAGSAVIICAAAIISHIIWNFPYAANATVVSFAGGDAQGRATLSSSRATWNNLAGVAFSYLGLPLANVLAGVVGETNKFAAVAFVLGIVMVVGYWVHFKVTDGYEQLEDPNAPVAKKQKTSAKDMAKSLFQNMPLLLLLVADLAKWIVKFIVAASAIYFFKYTANQPALVPIYILLANIAAVIGAFCSKYFTKALSNRGTIIMAYLIMAAAMIISYIAFQSTTLVVILMIVAQCCYGICYACSPALYADTAVYAEWKTKKNSAGWIMGLQTVPLKVGVIVKATILNACLAAAGYDAILSQINGGSLAVENIAATSRQAISASFTLWPGIFCAIGALILIFGYRLTKEKVEKYQAEIDARAKA